MRCLGVHIRELLTTLGVYTAHPVAFLILVVYTICWFVFERETLNWHGVATLATWCMTLFIQRAEHRDTQAIHAKLDELLRAEGKARSELATLDKKEPEEIEAHRDHQQARGKRSAKSAGSKAAGAKQAKTDAAKRAGRA